MFEEYKARRAVEKELKEILGREPTDYERKTFLAMFLKTYRNRRFMYSKKYHGNDVDNLIAGLKFGSSSASGYVHSARITKWRGLDTPEKVIQRVYRLGESFGNLLGVIEYGLTSKILIGNEEKLDRAKGEILEHIVDLVKYLKRMNSSIKLKFIRNRILDIAVKLRARGLSKYQQQLIFEIASIFQ